MLTCREGKSTAIAAHSGTVRSVNFASNGRMLMSSSDDKTIKVWALPTQRFMFTLSGHMNWVRTAQFSPDCRLAVSGSDDKSMRIWDIQAKRLLRIYDEHAGAINSVAFHPDGTCIASAGNDKVIKVWDIRCALCFALTLAHIAHIQLACTSETTPSLQFQCPHPKLRGSYRCHQQGCLASERQLFALFQPRRHPESVGRSRRPALLHSPRP